MSFKDKKRSLKAWSLEEKLAAVTRVRAGESITGVARNIGASPASVCEWKKIEGKLREGFAMRGQQALCFCFFVGDANDYVGFNNFQERKL